MAEPSPETLRLAEEVTDPATFIATQVYLPLSSIVTPRIHRVASPVSLWELYTNAMSHILKKFMFSIGAGHVRMFMSNTVTNYSL